MLFFLLLHAIIQANTKLLCVCVPKRREGNAKDTHHYIKSGHRPDLVSSQIPAGSDQSVKRKYRRDRREGHSRIHQSQRTGNRKPRIRNCPRRYRFSHYQSAEKQQYFCSLSTLSSQQFTHKLSVDRRQRKMYLPCVKRCFFVRRRHPKLHSVSGAVYPGWGFPCLIR